MTEYHCKYDELVDPVKLVDHPKNANRHPARQLCALEKFVEHSGWRHPVIVSRLTDRIVAGHARKVVAIRRGDLIPVVYQDFTNEAEERLFLAADNKLAELAELDIELLEMEMQELELLSIPILDFGFEISKNREAADPEIPDIQIDDKISLEKVTLFVEESLKKEVLKKLNEIVASYDAGLLRLVT